VKDDPLLTDTTSAVRLAQALAQVKKDVPGTAPTVNLRDVVCSDVFIDVYVTYTGESLAALCPWLIRLNLRPVGCFASGMPFRQFGYVTTTKDNGFTIDALVLMTMNMGGTNNVVDAQTAIMAGAGQLGFIYGISILNAVKMMGILLAIGVDNQHNLVNLEGIASRTSCEFGHTCMPFFSYNH